MSLDVTKIDKLNCRFKHYRMLTNFKEFFNKKQNNKNKYYTANIRTNKNRLSSTGGITICTFIDKINNNILIGISFCNILDKFEKKKGAELAYNNLVNSGLNISLPISTNNEFKFIYTSIFLGKYIKSIIQNHITNNLKFHHNKILI